MTVKTAKKAVVETLCTGFPGVDRLLSSTPRGATVLLCGPPGAGKTTLAIQIAARVQRMAKQPVLHACGEQDKKQFRKFAKRISEPGVADLALVCDGAGVNVYTLTAEAERLKPTLLVVDSAQAAFVPDVNGYSGGVTQTKAVANWLAAFGKVERVSTILTSHTTQVGAPPAHLVHLFDIVLRLDIHRRCLRTGRTTHARVPEEQVRGDRRPEPALSDEDRVRRSESAIWEKIEAKKKRDLIDSATS